MTQTFDRLAEFVLRTTPDDVPTQALDAARWLLLDTMGIAAAAMPMEAGRLARDGAVYMFNSGVPEHQASIMFDGRSASLVGATYAAATAIDNLDGHDGYNPTKGHIGVVVLPTLATLLQHRPNLSGPEILTATVIGYEVAGRAAIALHASVDDYHTSGAWNALGVAAMTARMRGLSEEQLRQALGIAEFHGPRSQMMREIANPTMLHDGSGWGALAGMSAALLAEQGFTGAPAITVEAEEAARNYSDLGSDWQVTKQYIKPYPICRWAHAAIDAVRELMMAHNLAADDIEKIDIRTFHEAAQLFTDMPATTSQAQYSLPFAVASYASHGEIGVAQISGSGLSDPKVRAMLDRISVRESDRHSNRFPAGRWADATIQTRDGHRLSSGDKNARGGPEEPLSEADILAKYDHFAVPVLGQQRADAIRNTILGFSASTSCASDLLSQIFDPPD